MMDSRRPFYNGHMPDKIGGGGRGRGRGRGAGGQRDGYFGGQRGAQSLDSLTSFTQERREFRDRPNNDGRSRGNARNKYKPREHPMGFKALEKLKDGPFDQIVLELLSERSGFNLLLEDESITPDKFDLLIHVLFLATHSQSNKSGIYELFNKICEKNFIDKLTKHAYTIKRTYPERAKQFFTHLIEFLTCFADVMKTNAIEKLLTPIEMILSALKPLKESGYISEELFKKYEELLEKLTELQKKWEQAQKLDVKDKKRLKAEMDHLEPPDDFREMSVLPLPMDIILRDRPFLRKNITEGRYRDGDHYLDVQFRLLREDFVRPLRFGINDFKSDSRKPIRDVRIYRGVTIHEAVLSGRKIYHAVKLNLGKIKLENSKRLLFGNLVCFSKDNFKTLILGSVAERDQGKLKNGFIGVEFESETNSSDLDGQFVMVESRAYFTAYKHILKALQNVKGDALPMEPYLVHVQPNVEPPTYLRHDTTYDLRVLKNLKMMNKSEAINKLLINMRRNTAVYKDLYDYQNESEISEPDDDFCHHLKAIQIRSDLYAWPSSNELGLDDSQHRALRSALTRQLAIIQGPPGTGKTFLGLKIVQALLHNSSAWKNADIQAPILVVCYTNHALDQFLEGMTSYTSNIVRVGSRTKSETIGRFQINMMARNITGYRSTVYARNFELRQQLEETERKINNCKAVVDACQAFTGIIFLDYLIANGVIPDHLIPQLQAARGDQKLAGWLMYNVQPENINSFGNRMLPHNSIKRKASQEINIEGKQDKMKDDNEVKDGEIIEELNKMEEQDRILEDFDDYQANTEAHRVVYEIEERQLIQQMEILWNEYEANYNGEALLRYNIVNGQWEILKYGLNSKEDPDKMNELENQMQLNLWKLPFPKRWQLYKYWIRKLEKKVKKKLMTLGEQLKTQSNARDEIRNQEYLHVMRKVSIVGMTTTGAAQYNALLQDLAPAIVVIEEAAEILESHVVTSLSSKCQHLIMIGDHQQLQPSATVFELATKYGLQTSLFERMIKNGLAYETLEYQHRMRPEISKLLVPNIYPHLKDHSSVKEFPNIKGITKNMYFITHEISEREESDDNNSHENQHEAEFLIALCRHLMLQGYSPEDVTILTPYSGQFFLLRKLQRDHIVCQGVRISIVDNFQGEENKIILLSLVRSNLEGKVGFLSTENRVCVALSRAKEGLYITGNINLLSKSSKLWGKIQSDLTCADCISDSLTLQCSNHPDQLMTVSTGNDIKRKSPEGGCMQVCGMALPICKHSCPKLCHMDDLEHREYKCLIPCRKILCSLGHPCPKRCWQECGPCLVPLQKTLACGHTHMVKCYITPENFSCPTMVEKEIPHCQHKAIMPCHKDPARFTCPEDCDTRLDCGHKCRLKCHRTEDPDHLKYDCYEKCTKVNAGCTEDHPCLKKCYQECGACTVQVTKTLPCRHTASKVDCSKPVEEIKCMQNCKRTLPCGHQCKKLCYLECGEYCPVKVKKTVPSCNDVVTINCSEKPTAAYCDGACPKTLPCGHFCTRRCKDACVDQCMELVNSATVCPKGHIIKLPCHLKETAKGELAWPYCREPCNKVLDCEHPCVGKCGVCFHGRLHVACRKPCKKPLVCGHICKQPCSAQCPPCQEKCQWKCNHSRCRKLCGTPCEPCKMECSWKCKHHKCDKKCGEKCSRPPCDQPCSQKLKCGHPCIGFCGDPCPPLCRECDKEELADFVLLGLEEEPDARFVYLEDCGHTIEVEGLEGWLNQESAEIGMKQCPKCRSTIYNNRRYQNIVLETYKTVKRVKAKFNIFSRNSIERRDIELILRDPLFEIYFPNEAKKIIMVIGIGPELSKRKKQNQKFLNDGELKLLYFQAHVLKKAIDILEGSREDKDSSQVSGIGYGPFSRQKKPKYNKRLKENIDVILERILQQKITIAQQMMKEVSCELQRQMILPAYWKFQEKVASYPSNDQLLKIKARIEKLMDPTVIFDEELDKKVRTELKASENYCGGLGITDGERVMIVKAMGLSQGHWFKCRNGHIYSIGECGGAMEMGKCPECKDTIGGTSHRLTSGNALAREMDGASGPAYPSMR